MRQRILFSLIGNSMTNFAEEYQKLRDEIEIKRLHFRALVGYAIVISMFLLFVVVRG